MERLGSKDHPLEQRPFRAALHILAVRPGVIATCASSVDMPTAYLLEAEVLASNFRCLSEDMFEVSITMPQDRPLFVISHSICGATREA